MSLRPLPALVLLLAACAPEAISPAMPPAPPAAVEEAPPPAGAAPWREPPVQPPELPVTTEPLPPLSREIVEVAYQAAAPESVHARGPREAWILTEDMEVLQHDGRRVVKVHQQPCMPGGLQSMIRHTQVIALRDEVRAYGMMPGNRSSAFEHLATLRGGRWSCGGTDASPGTYVSAGQEVWSYGCYPSGPACWIRTGGQMARLPALLHDGQAWDAPPPRVAAVWLRAPDDAWMSSEEGGLYRYRGVVFRPVEIPAGLVIDAVLPAADGSAWMAFHRADATPAEGRPPRGGGLGRWDGERLSPVAVPEDFRVDRLLAGSGREVWMLGQRRAVYQWDGQRLRGGRLAFDVRTAWASAEAGVWIGGAAEGRGRLAHVAPAPESR